MTLSTLGWAVLVLVAVLVGLAKTALPGLAVLAASLVATVVPARESTGLLLLMLLVGDVLAISLYRRQADFRTLRRLLPWVVLGVLFGGGYLRVADDGTIRHSIGVILVVMTLLTIWSRHRRTSHEADPTSSADATPRADAMSPARSTAVAGTDAPVRRACFGSLAGFTTMVANAGAPVTNMYFLSAGFEVSRFLGTTAWFYFIVNVVKLPVSVAAGGIAPVAWPTAALMAPVVIVSALLGYRLAARLPARVFEPVVLALTLLGAGWLLL